MSLRSCHQPSLRYLAAISGICGSVELVWDAANTSYGVQAVRAGALPVRGSGSASGFEVACGEGELVVGVLGAVYDTAITRLQVQCATVSVTYDPRSSL